MPEEEIDQHDCRMHGNKLRVAYDHDISQIVGVYQAIRQPDHEYSCPRCDLRVYPESDTPIIPMNVIRHAHFNAPPGYGKQPRSGHSAQRKYTDVSQLVKETIAAKLRESGDFSYVGFDVPYRSERRCKEDKLFYTQERFNLDVFCRRDSPESLDVVFHVIELPMANTKLNEVYDRVANLATEYSCDKRKIVSGEKSNMNLEDEVIIGNRHMHRRVYQNFVVVMNESAIKVGRTRAELPPTIHNFVAYLTDNRVFFIDPETLETSLFAISDPRKVKEERDTNEHNPNMSYRFRKQDMPHFSLVGQQPSRKVRRFANVEPDDPYRRKYSINMPNFRLALPTIVELGSDGKPFSAERKGNQTEFIL